MASKPRKAFDGVGRPQGFIDDTIVGAAKAIGRSIKKDYTIARKARVIEKFIIDEKMARSPEGIRRIAKRRAKAQKPPMPKQLPSIKGKNPRPKPDMGNPKAPTTADVDRILSKANAERTAVEAKKSAQKRMSPYYKTSKNSRNYRG
jgi:hypothetical protein